MYSNMVEGNLIALLAVLLVVRQTESHKGKYFLFLHLLIFVLINNGVEKRIHYMCKIFHVQKPCFQATNVLSQINANVDPRILLFAKSVIS